VVPDTRPVEAARSQSLGKTGGVSFPGRKEIAAATERVCSLCLAVPETSAWATVAPKSLLASLGEDA
jgi:hypothetical protein